jgi:hypothetical protein
VCACLCNLAISDENKFEIAKSGALPPLISLLQHADMGVASQTAGCLANLAEMRDIQTMLTREGAIKPCIAAMRNRFVEVRARPHHEEQRWGT